MSEPILIFAFGNPGRGDDGLGPQLLDTLQQTFNSASVAFLTDFQLQIEHILDLEQRQLVIFIDASVSCAAPFDWQWLKPVDTLSYTTHAMTPAALLQIYQTIKHQPPPDSFLLSIRGEHFELGAPLSEAARQNLRQALDFVRQRLHKPNLQHWKHCCDHARNIPA